jgi:hypothetical protein
MMFLLVSFVKVTASGGISPTGHAEILELDFLNSDKQYYLLSQMSDAMINNALKNVKKKAFGYSIYKINNEVPAWYISEIIFSRANNTNQTISFKYNFNYAKTTTVEYSLTGSLSVKLSGKLSALSLSVDPSVKASVENTTKNFYEEKSQFQFDIIPNHKISFIVRGECDISTGVGKYYFLGIPMKKGTWELIDIRTEYYELIDETI